MALNDHYDKFDQNHILRHLSGSKSRKRTSRIDLKPISQKKDCSIWCYQHPIIKMRKEQSNPHAINSRDK